MKLWHDDWRPAPDDTWEIARTNEEALAYLETGKVEEASLDYVLGSFEENGMMLVEAMIEREHIPPKVNIHSWSSEADKMARALLDAGCLDVTVEASDI